MTVQLRRVASVATETESTPPRKRKRHAIDLSQPRRQERSVSRGFKIWMGAYALVMLAGISFAASPAQSQIAPVQIKQAQQENVNTARAAQTKSTVTIDDAQSGKLLFKSSEPGRFIEAPMVKTNIEIDVTGPVSRTSLTQTFTNPSSQWQEGLYVFPLPDEAAVDHLKMKIGDRLIEGQIKSHDQARKIYEMAKNKGKKASLVEQQRPNLFTNSVANIGPGESIAIAIEYQQTIAQNGNQFSLRVPLVVAPRYNPDDKPLKPVIHQDIRMEGDKGWSSSEPVSSTTNSSSQIPVPAQRVGMNPVTLALHLDAGFPLAEVNSSYHEIIQTKDDEGKISLSLKEETIPADRDFVLTWKAKAGNAPTLGLFKQIASDKTEAQGDDYLLAYLSPPYKLSALSERPRREVIFVLDQSGSMEGQSIIQAKASLITALRQLTPRDKFQIIRFNNHYTSLFEAPARADKETIAQAIRWTEVIRADGGTEMAPALQAALRDQSADRRGLRQVVFLTDGAISNEHQLFQIAKAEKGRSRIFTVGIGSAPNSFFMSRIAEVGRGTFTHIGDVKEVKKQMEALFAQLSRPVATDLELEVTGGESVEVSPAQLPDLYLGEPLVVALKGKKLNGKLTFKGRFDNQPWSLSVDLADASPSRAIGKLWARKKIRSLEGNRILSDDHESIDREIQQLGLEHHLVTRLTSLVAVDMNASRPDGELLQSSEVPLNLPHGWEQEVSGQPDLHFLSPAATSSRSVKMAAPAPNKRQHHVSTETSPKPVTEAANRNRSNEETDQTTKPSPTPHITDRPHANWLILGGIASLLLAGSLMVWNTRRKIRA